MLRALLAATALTTTMAMPVLAQETETNTDTNAQTDTQVEAPMDSETGVDTEMDAGASVETDGMAADDLAADDDMMAEDDDMMAADSSSSVSLSTGYMQSDDDFLGSKIMGATVWNSASEDAEKIGDINDIIFNANGRMIAAVIGIGGFLEIGEKSVAVGFNELEWTTDVNGEPRLVLTGSSYEALEAAPEFVWETPESTMDPAMTDMDAGAEMGTDMGVDPNAGAAVEGDATMDIEAPLDSDAALETDAETDATMDAEGDTVMDPEADATAGADAELETPAADAEVSTDADATVNG